MAANDMVRIGCCGFTRGMQRYFQTFDLVELQKTFYQLPQPQTAVRWREQAPPHFEFTMKAWQGITHLASSPTYRKARLELPDPTRRHLGHFQPTEEVFQAWENTRRIAEMLHATVVVFQCPPNFRESPQATANLRSFFGAIERGSLRLAIEFRAKWHPQVVRDLCAELDLIHCVDPFAGEPLYGDPVYFRLHGSPPGPRMYRYTYTEADFHALAQHIDKGLEKSKRVYCLFNNLSMWDDALRFREFWKEHQGRGSTSNRAVPQ